MASRVLGVGTLTPYSSGICYGKLSTTPCEHPWAILSFQKGPPPDKAKLKRWWTYLSQFRLPVNHIPGKKNELFDNVSRKPLDALIGESSGALAKVQKHVHNILVGLRDGRQRR